MTPPTRPNARTLGCVDKPTHAQVPAFHVPLGSLDQGKKKREEKEKRKKKKGKQKGAGLSKSIAACPTHRVVKAISPLSSDSARPRCSVCSVVPFPEVCLSLLSSLLSAVAEN